MSSYVLIIPFQTELYDTDHVIASYRFLVKSCIYIFFKSLTGRSNKIVIYVVVISRKR